MTLEIEVFDQQQALDLDHDDIRALARFCLEAESADVGVSVVFVDDTAMTEIHGRYLSDATPTDVMTFPLDDEFGDNDLEIEGAGNDDPEGLSSLGEIIVSTETALRQAPEHRGDPVVECLEYVVHGILHLTGYDDVEEVDAQRMLARQAELLDAWIVENSSRSGA